MSLVYEMFGKKVKDLSKEEKAEYFGIANRKFYAKNGNIYQKKHYDKTLLDYYVVYYLPKEHYCGVTNNPERRMTVHKSYGNDPEGWRVLSCHDTLLEARHQENLFHSVLGIEGMSLR